MPEKTMDRLANTASAGTAITAPVWAPSLAQVNELLQMVSLLVGIGFVLWQWRRLAKAKQEAGK
jgi:hypothetical protein